MPENVFNPNRPSLLTLQSDSTANDSDKKLTVPDRLTWQVLSIWVEYTATATAGNRQLVIEIQDDSDDVVMQVRAGDVQAESTTFYYLFAAGMPDLTGERDSDYMMTPLPPLFLNAGWDIRVYDNNAVAAAADDVVIHAIVLEQ